MKKGVIISLLLICCCYAGFSQNTDSLANCKTLEDTLQYVQRKLVDHKSEYIGKPAEVIFEAFQRILPVKYTAISETSSWMDPEKKGNSYVDRISLYCEDLEVIQHFPAKRKLIFKVKFMANKVDYYELTRNIPDEEYGTAEALKYVKDFIVKDISVRLSHPRD